MPKKPSYRLSKWPIRIGSKAWDSLTANTNDGVPGAAGGKSLALCERHRADASRPRRAADGVLLPAVAVDGIGHSADHAARHVDIMRVVVADADGSAADTRQADALARAGHALVAGNLLHLLDGISCGEVVHPAAPCAVVLGLSEPC